MSTRHTLYECGICDGLHPWEWDGDCREDANRYANESDYMERKKVTSSFDVEILSWQDRLDVDSAIADADNLGEDL